MTKQEQIGYLKQYNFEEWSLKRREVEARLSTEQTIFCCCGRPASYLHESHCRKFKARVEAETLKELKHLLDGRQ